MENKRRKNHTDLECVQTGFANGVAPGFPLTESEKWKMVDEAERISGETCEFCGKIETAKIRSHKGWFYTSCDEHAKGNIDDNNK